MSNGKVAISKQEITKLKQSVDSLENEIGNKVSEEEIEEDLGEVFEHIRDRMDDLEKKVDRRPTKKWVRENFASEAQLTDYVKRDSLGDSLEWLGKWINEHVKTDGKIISKLFGREI